MDKLKAKNIPSALQKSVEEQTISTVQISAEEWNRLCKMVQQMQALSSDLTAQRADLKSSAESCRYNEKSGTGANRSLREGDTEDSERSHRTGWEGERESFRSYRETYRSGRSNMVDSPRAHGGSDDIGVALMGARGLGNLTGIFDDREETEKEKQQRGDFIFLCHHGKNLNYQMSFFSIT